MLNSALSARHFTTSAIHIIEQLRPRRVERGMPNPLSQDAITLLALWSLLRWERRVGIVALEQMGVDPHALARDVDLALVKTSETNQTSQKELLDLRLDNWVEPLLSGAEHEAMALHHNYVGTEHLLLEIVTRACPRLRAILEAHAITHEQVKASALDVLCGKGSITICGGGGGIDPEVE